MTNFQAFAVQEMLDRQRQQMHRHNERSLVRHVISEAINIRPNKRNRK